METELAHLERQAERLAQLVERLSAHNQRLQRQVAQLEADKRILEGKLAQAIRGIERAVTLLEPAETSDV
ncbi:MAG: hypothetical protein KBB07_00890 [Tepidiphilus sp.]|jgi:predicted RNase H-like nuclease (RuvC/YqgF family)|uniref:Cell division protein ZapB n=1 Tax=Tepidiphilus thermophilus TaxID=876478 RepID=A0A0K6IRV4_9PROT|nr:MULTISPECIES: hypothetical protein [Tepidiphilus]MBP6998197.1 hypothetical protein [Tepidiphilus sp.]MDD2408196.1 hypothetical protein [Tepidiphilus sp.]MDK2797733.1 hypothetical protein [Tepidiphilus sp.]CUB05823.1 hypothetical protein Ga0061068_102160 [Tepidiphilus thermophilus]